MPKKLRNMDIKEVSGVDKAANRRKFLIAKREGGSPLEKKTILKADLADEYQVAIEALGLSVNETINSSEMDLVQKSADIEASFEEFTTFCKSATATTFAGNIAAKEVRSHMWEATDALFDAVTTKLQEGADPAAVTTEVAKDLDDFKNFIMGMVAAASDVTNLTKSGAKIASGRLDNLKAAHKTIGDVIAEAAGEPPEGGKEPIQKGDDQTLKAEDIKKAVEEGLAPIILRVEALEKADPAGNPDPANNPKPDPEPTQAEVLKNAISEAIEPLNQRLETLEKARGVRKSVGGDDDSTVQKSAGVFSGVLL